MGATEVSETIASSYENRYAMLCKQLRLLLLLVDAWTLISCHSGVHWNRNEELPKHRSTNAVLPCLTMNRMMISEDSEVVVSLNILMKALSLPAVVVEKLEL